MVEKEPLPTAFAPAEREEVRICLSQHGSLLNAQPMQVMLDAVPIMVFVLNRWRQIVFANEAATDSVGQSFREYICGLRPGEALGCVHAAETQGGCGTTEFCEVCGVAGTILSGLKGKADVQECRIIRDIGIDALDLRVWTTPLSLQEEAFTIFAVVDITDEKRREALERIFFHDVMNTAVGLRGFSELLQGAAAEEMREFQGTIHDLSERLVGEIQEQRELSMAETGDIEIDPAPVDSRELLEHILRIYEKHEVARDRRLCIDKSAEKVDIRTDRTLLGRVVGNMTKNALEATDPGGTVTLGCTRENGHILFRVHNPTVIPREAQLQVFQRSFSTKGQGRGLGTYGMRLLSERYLQGEVSFTSSSEKGTTFEASYPLKL